MSRKYEHCVIITLDQITHGLCGNGVQNPTPDIDLNFTAEDCLYVEHNQNPEIMHMNCGDDFQNLDLILCSVPSPVVENDSLASAYPESYYDNMVTVFSSFVYIFS